MQNILLYDTTLRDGMQGENICFSLADKVKIAKRLDDMGIHYIEGGWPGSSPGALHFFELARSIEFKNAKFTAFGSTRKPLVSPSQDTNLRELVNSEAPVITIFGKSWDLHVETVMNNTLDENLAMIEESIAYLKDHSREVIYDAEHFYDGYIENPDYAVNTLAAAAKGGCTTLVLCDTNGGTLSHDIERITRAVITTIRSTVNPHINFGIHAHNDCSMAVANSISAVRSGAVMVQGTINGYGERCGNADLTSIIPILALKMDSPCISMENLKKLKALSRFVSETANMIPLNARPFVGKSAFAHKGGIHVSAVTKESRAYEHIAPELVGNKRRVLVSEQSGKSNIEYKAREMGISFDGKGIMEKNIISIIKELEDEGFQFEVAEGSLKILMEKLTNQFTPHFELESFRVTVEKDKERPCYAYAMIKIRVDDKTVITAAEGDGPVSALDNALRKALSKIFPDINDMHLIDFKVRVIEGSDGTDAKVRVIIESRDENNIFSTIGVSEDIIEASWQALADSFQYKLSLNRAD
ncbi:MAG: citramalate synthase [Thermodesulfobacteriota bacterium]|nr:citramalate synthase [Thermodesulfobacteriota bacterium]